MSILSKPWVRSGLRYLAITLVCVAAITIYTSERNAPVIEEFATSTVEVEPTKDPGYKFSGIISDERGIASVNLECVSDGAPEFVIVVATSGINKNQVSFGRTSSSPNWIGRWDGNKQRIEFEGAGDVPLNTPSLTCEWQANLKDSLGNEITTPLGVVMTVRN